MKKVQKFFEDFGKSTVFNKVLTVTGIFFWLFLIGYVVVKFAGG